MSKPSSGSSSAVSRGNSVHNSSSHHSKQHQQGQRNQAQSQPSPRTSVSGSGHGQTPAATAGQGGDAGALLRELKTLIGQPVRLALDDGREEFGLLWSFDAGMGVVALEIPRTVSAVIEKGNDGERSVSKAIPSAAAAYPTAMLSTVKVAAQGGDASGARTSFTLLKLRRIQRVEKLQTGSSSASLTNAVVEALQAAKATVVKQEINTTAAEARERAATAEAMKRAAKIGVGVSTLGQSVFDALNKTLPCRWADRHIVVMDEFVISPDKYDTVNVTNVPTATLQALERGEKVDGVPNDIGAQLTRWQRVKKVLEGERKKLNVVNGGVTAATTTTTTTA